MSSPLSRAAVIRAAVAAYAALAALPRAAFGASNASAGAPHLYRIAVRNATRRYPGDRRLLATVSPAVPGRDRANVSFDLNRRAVVRLEALRTSMQGRFTTVWETVEDLPAGRQTLSWQVDPKIAVGTYLLRLTVEDSRGLRRVYGGKRPRRASASRAPVVRVLGVEALFRKRSYAAGETMRLDVTADAASLTVQFLHCGTEPEYTDRLDEMRGNPVSDPVTIDWRRNRNRKTMIELPAGSWLSGIYAARISTDDGRLGFAPIVIRPAKLGTVREAVIVPTNTWQAYNFYDADGDGWGDTWYAGGNPPVELTRPYRERGTPPRWRRYDVGFQKWLRSTNRTPDQLSEDDLEAFASGDDLRKLYDLVVFPGHTEYVTEHAYVVVTRFRDLGGRLIFLSANNFFWKVSKRYARIRRVALWRNLGHPEARLIGVQYRANDNGSKQGPYSVVNSSQVPWLWRNTGLTDGSLLGDNVGGYGIEIDSTTKDSPPGTIIVAAISNLFGAGLNAEMSYYETPAGARVFAAGTLDFCGTIHWFPQRQLMENVWRRLTSDVVPPPL